MFSIFTRRLLGSMALLLSTSFALGALAKVGVLLKSKAPFWSAVEKGAIEAGAALGAEVVVKAPMSESDISVQIQLINALVRQEVQAIVIAPENKDALAGPVAAAEARGIKIVVLDSPLAGDSTRVFIGTDQHAAGAAAGVLMAGLLQAKDELSVLKHNQTGGATEQRELGALEEVRTKWPNLVIHGDIYASSESGTEEQKAELLLTRYPQTKGVLASSTPGTMAMLKVLQAKGLAGKIQFVGFGFNLNPEVAAAIESGAMQGWIAQLPKNVGYKGVEAAIALLKGEKPPTVIHIDFIVITKDNLKTPAVQTLLAR